MYPHDETPFSEFSLASMGGIQRLTQIIDDFYTRLLQDPMIGFHFKPFPKEQLVRGQVEFVRRIFGDRSGTYELRPLKQVHSPFKLLPGQIARRFQILKETLQDWKLDESCQKRWLNADEKVASSLT